MEDAPKSTSEIVFDSKSEAMNAAIDGVVAVLRARGYDSGTISKNLSEILHAAASRHDNNSSDQ